MIGKETLVPYLTNYPDISRTSTEEHHNNPK